MSSLINDLKLLAAHHAEALKIAQRIIRQQESQAKGKGKGLDAELKATVLAKRRRTALNK